MRKRCSNQNHISFKYYGGRGIDVCLAWQAYPVFHDWAMDSGYTDTLSIDRIDTDKGYTPSNCRWATAAQQANNRRPRVEKHG
ncbi:MAG: hypothetical protein K0Q92_624 [Steroidobacteraceae bacterium]|nr:hypothetical protein [Steroidobacteraceae bacterium]